MNKFLTVGAVALLFAMSANAAMISAFVNSIASITPTENWAYPQAGFGFYANSSGTATINQLGFYDGPNGAEGSVGDGLQVAHDVGLLITNEDNSHSVIAKVTIPAGTGATLSGGYRWVSIPEVTLTKTSQGADFYILVASMDTDNWSWSGGVEAVSGQSFGTLTNNGWSSSAAMQSVGMEDSIYPDVGYTVGGPNMGYAVPEPSLSALLVTGLVGWLASARRKRS